MARLCLWLKVAPSPRVQDAPPRVVTVTWKGTLTCTCAGKDTAWMEESAGLTRPTTRRHPSGSVPDVQADSRTVSATREERISDSQTWSARATNPHCRL